MREVCRTSLWEESGEPTALANALSNVAGIIFVSRAWMQFITAPTGLQFMSDRIKVLFIGVSTPAKHIKHRHESASYGAIVDRNVRNCATYFEMISIHLGKLTRLHDRVLPVSCSLFPLFPAKVVVQILVFKAQWIMNHFETSPRNKGQGSKGLRSLHVLLIAHGS